jgi:zinc transport system permease protein
MDDFLWRAALGAAMLGAAAGPIGCFVLWRRMAYLGESVAHMGLLGAAIGLLMGISPLVGVSVLAVVAALLMARAGDNLIPAGTFVGIVGHAGLALGFVLLASMETVRTDLLGYLFGDVLALSDNDLLAIAAASAFVLAGCALFWRAWLMQTVNGDIARAEGRTSRFAGIAFLVLVAALVAFGLRVVGALLIVALLIVPPAAARPLSRTPESMAVWAAVFGALSAPLGLTAAYWKDYPAGPCIVLAAVALFAITTLSARIADILKSRS